ncbi:site-specific DNA-methyltransferase [Enteractinococcus coprophilus]|uniref:Site-specific DNA-methyltransferase (Adenine-specific)/adenine-specific DNA-methyltransferase n=1 Tax=Enteractinococcus coprophilus TaxID=1027633 RepID=A0A543ANS3_9MICC|nr:site-specific DNA-methyltransferase [Enteractinococcus coprophilus]TQL74234.1 site-specific DNA-methyltransferase (adenine-specific)/adenine-specific DNA-methyltransferase [Enteractinococcus coprophilus]
MIEQQEFQFDTRPTIKGFPELRWTGKRPYRSTVYYPAQLRESYGSPAEGGEHDGWMNKIYWGDNLQVMSHLLRDYRGQVDLIYIDPPFDSKADYKKKISLRGQNVTNDSTSFEEKQYSDIWTNDEYLQFMYERLILCRELLADTGSIYLHCDWRKGAHLKLLMDEVFGPSNFQNEIIWRYSGWNRRNGTYFNRRHDTIYYYSKTSSPFFSPYKLPWESPEQYARERRQALHTDEEGRLYIMDNAGGGNRIKRLVEDALPEGRNIDDVWLIGKVNNSAHEGTGYPTQKPEDLVGRIVESSSPLGGLVFDCFAGSGTTQSVAMKLGRRFIGADINLGAMQTTTKRLINVGEELSREQRQLDLLEEVSSDPKFTGFEVYNVNNYDFFRNPVEAKQLLMQALEVQPFPQADVFDGELDGRMVKIMPVNRIATKADLAELLANLPYKTYEKRKEENPGKAVERITLVCMGHEPDLRASLEQELDEYNVEVDVVDILRDRADLQLKREAEAEVVCEGGKLVIRQFYPLNLMQKLSLQKDVITDWRELVDSITIDFNFDGVVMQPAVTDVPDKKELVSGIYDIPEDAGTIKVKITDVLAEILEVEVS